jgi:hypothetical protein
MLCTSSCSHSSPGSGAEEWAPRGMRRARIRSRGMGAHRGNKVGPWGKNEFGVTGRKDRATAGGRVDGDVTGNGERGL